MPTAKTILKRASRRRGSVSLARVRKAVDSVLAKNSTVHVARPSRKTRPTKSSKSPRAAHISQ